MAGCVQKIYAQKKETFVIVLDEYDVFIREKDLESQLQIYLGFLNSLFKNAELVPAISLAYITGILPIMKDKIQSKLNTFRQYTMLEPSVFAEFVGFLPEEVQTICQKYGCSFEECKNWYDGYRLEDFEVYNPESVMIAALTGKFKSYWSETSTYNIIKEMPAGKGIADIVYIPLASNKDQTAIIVEVKHNKSAESALTQIKQKHYFDCLENWHGDLLFVGANYDEKAKKHDCKIEKFVK